MGAGRRHSSPCAELNPGLARADELEIRPNSCGLREDGSLKWLVCLTMVAAPQK